MDIRGTEETPWDVVKCGHHPEDGRSKVVDQEIRQINPRTYDVYDVYKCPKGHVFTVFVERKRISDETVQSMFI